MTIYTFSLEDIGSRRQHLMELQQLWSDGLSILITQMRAYETEEDKERKQKLETAIEMLENYLTKDFQFESLYGRAINELPKDAKDIPDERNQADGTV